MGKIASHPDRKMITGALAATFSAYFTTFFALSTLNVALPRMAAELNGMQYFSWAIAIPALVTAVTTLIFGKLSDLYGRRALMMASIAAMLLGTILSATSQTFAWLVASLCIFLLGQGAIQPLCFSILGDLFPPAARSRWAGLLNISSVVSAFVGPTIGGWFVDQLSWRFLFWLNVPIILLTGVIILVGLPRFNGKQQHRIDFPGAVILAMASTTLVLGLSWAGSTYPWASFQTMGLLGTSIVLWALFLKLESRAAEPMLNPKLLSNRTFLIASLAAMLSIFGFTSLIAYFPLFLQGVKGTSATLSGQVITPFSVLVSIMGIPAGLLIAKTRRYKWMYVTGYAILCMVMAGAAFLNSATPLVWGFVISAMAGIGLGSIPTINAMVVQYAVPKGSLGEATGGLYFFISLGRAIAPAILGSTLNSVYSRDLADRLPAGLAASLNQDALASLGNPRVLLSAEALAILQRTFESIPGDRLALFEQTVQAIRDALETGLRGTFLIGAVTMVVSFLLILRIPELKKIGE